MTAKIIFFFVAILLVSMLLIAYAKGEEEQQPPITKHKPPPTHGPIPNENCGGGTCVTFKHNDVTITAITNQSIIITTAATATTKNYSK